MIRDLELAFIKIHILHHAGKEWVFGIGLMAELARHGYGIGPGTLYPTLAKLEKGGFLTCAARTVEHMSARRWQHKQRKYYHITPKGSALLNNMRAKLKELYQEVIEEQ